MFTFAAAWHAATAAVAASTAAAHNSPFFTNAASAHRCAAVALLSAERGPVHHGDECRPSLSALQATPHAAYPCHSSHTARP